MTSNTKGFKDNPMSCDKDIYGGLAILIALGSLIFSFYTHNQLIKVDQAQVIVSQNEIKISSVGPPCPNGGNFSCDVIDPVIRNIGKAPAEDVQVELFGCFLEGQVVFGNTNLHCMKYWGTKLIGGISPGDGGGYGRSFIPQKEESCGDFIGRQFVLIFQISYIDTLKNNIQSQHSFSFFQYQIGRPHAIDGGSSLGFVVSEDLKKMCSWLESDLKKIGASKDLAEYVHVRCAGKGATNTNLKNELESLTFSDFSKVLAGIKMQ